MRRNLDSYSISLIYLKNDYPQKYTNAKYILKYRGIQFVCWKSGILMDGCRDNQ